MVGGRWWDSAGLTSTIGDPASHQPGDLMDFNDLKSMLGEVVGKTKTVPLDYDLVTTARALGVSFGD